MTHVTDGRYSCIKETSKWGSEPRWVIRFNGSRVGESFSKKIAQNIITMHQQIRANQKEAQDNG